MTDTIITNPARAMWNDRFADNEFYYGLEPNAYIKESSKNFTPNANILSIAEGEGRNALFLAQQGHNVTAIDISEVALEKSARLLKEHSYTLTTIHQDIAEWTGAEDEYDAIIMTYLHLPHDLFIETLKTAIKSLKQGGILAGEFFSTDQIGNPSGGPKDTSILYTEELVRSALKDEPVEIIDAKEEETILKEGLGHQGKANVIRLNIRKQPTGY